MLNKVNLERHLGLEKAFATLDMDVIRGELEGLVGRSIRAPGSLVRNVGNLELRNSGKEPKMRGPSAFAHRFCRSASFPDFLSSKFPIFRCENQEANPQS